ncbi:hypothetical protein F0562_019229 [Nyssa sinensis]|uniref:Uncharacterized protein n=1 Tax=Nyssa sinensis TaxID=561372 RepID=A0A5J4ZCA0_9ASTE|nr:hypothetical protein F0562_019229 [Nyssa sinensis]
MDDEKRKSGGGGAGAGGSGGNTEKIESVGTETVDEALKRCLELNKGDQTKCKSVVEAFKSPSSSKKPLTPLRLRSGSLTDV